MNNNEIISGSLNGKTVTLESSSKELLYDTSFYGQPKGDVLELTLIEAGYLIYKGRINVKYENKELDIERFMREASRRTDNFEVKYIVFKDLRERGYFIKPGVTDFRVYPRGGSPGKTPSRYFVYVLSERQPMLLTDLVRLVDTAANVKKELVMAVVDEESDITFYSARMRSMKGEMNLILSGPTIRASLLEDRVMVWDSNSSALLHDKFLYGKPLDKMRLHLSLVESAYLLEKEVLEIRDSSDSILKPNEFARRAVTVESDFPKKLAVYKDLRDKGMVVKTGYKFGSHYRVYKKVDPEKGMRHSEFLVHVLDNDHVFSLPHLSRAVRLANSVKKQMIFAWESRNNIVYLEINRIKM